MRSRRSTKASPSPLALQSWLAVVRTYNLCDAVMSQRLAALGLRLGEHEVLINLLRSPGITQQQLAERCFVAKSGVSMLVTRMEGSGHLLRETDPADARVRRLLLTSEGQALAALAQQVQNDVIAAMVGHTSDAELATIAEVMQRASVALEAMR